MTPYHLVARTNKRRDFAAPLKTVWDIYCDQLYFIHHAYGVKIHSFVLMRNHFHFIASFPNANLSESMRTFMGTTSKVISFEEGSKGHLYGGRVFRSRLSSFHYFLNAYKYVYLNPVRAGLCDRVEAYEFSTLCRLLGLSQLSIPVVEDTLLFDDVEGNLRWLNKIPSDEDSDAVRTALRKSEFKFTKDKSNRPHALESRLL